MRVVAFVKSTPEIEAGAAESDEQMLIEMGNYNTPDVAEQERRTRAIVEG
ncbi:MAG TPA: hypothetical protein VHM29_12250 [Acidimicrobiia bacterium]|jgi:hypothetical protein|nr:hypothetical protein [Acidimicrobiia bacterium]